MEDLSQILPILVLIIAVPCLVLFYWFLGFLVLGFVIRVVKQIWNNVDS